MLSLPSRSPAPPSISSRTMSAWPAWRSVSAIMWIRIVCSVTSARPSGHHGTRPRASSGRRSIVASECSHTRWYKPTMSCPRLLRRRPHVGVRLGALVEPRQRLGERSAERVAEVAGLDAGDVLDESQEVGARRDQRPTNVVLGDPVELPQQCVTGNLQVAVEFRLRIGNSHGRQHGTVMNGRHRAPSGQPALPDGRRVQSRATAIVVVGAGARRRAPSRAVVRRARRAACSPANHSAMPAAIVAA